MNTIREIEKINQEELDRGIAGTSASWHAQYEKSAWVYVGNLEHELTEGDVLCIMSQYGEVSSQGGTFPVSRMSQSINQLLSLLYGFIFTG
jgi:RNA recognition motif-containing protein